MRRVISAMLAWLLVTLSASSAWSSDDPGPIAEPVGAWDFQPDYSLPRNARKSAPRNANPEREHRVLRGETVEQRFLGAQQTGRYGDLLVSEEVPADDFTVELWLLDHVNTDIGAMAGVFSGPGKRDNHWALGYYGDTVAFGALSDDNDALLLDTQDADLEPYKGRWLHIIGSWNGEVLKIYFNGRKVAEKRPEYELQRPEEARFDLLSFTQEEQYMGFANILQGAQVFDTALSDEAIDHLFEARTSNVDVGIVHSERFHFTAGPYLNAPMERSVSLIAETDRAAELTVRYGVDPETMASITSDMARLHAITLEDLAPDTSYFYEVVARDGHGEEISSGLLTFQTAVREGQPFRFAVIGDTEARPFVNNAVAQGVWEARPHFAVLLGDLTDGGFESRRFEWTHEFFVGMGPLVERLPVIATPGNGEADLHWYRHYHNLPGEENYYAWRYGNVEFFVLDSNLSDREREDPGFRARQREWLAEALASSNARWKIAVHHHPVFTSDENDYGDSWSEAGRGIGDVQVREDFMGLYDQYGVDIVLYGHMHIYERSHPMRAGQVDVLNGTIYIGSGGGGGNLEDFTPTRQGYSATTFRGYHFGLFDISGDIVRYEVRDTEGRLRDTLSFVKHGDERAVRQHVPTSQNR